MPVSPADFEFYSRMTGQPIPNTPAGRMAIAPQVYNMRRGGGGFGRVLANAARGAVAAGALAGAGALALATGEEMAKSPSSAKTEPAKDSNVDLDASALKTPVASVRDRAEAAAANTLGKIYNPALSVGTSAQRPEINIKRSWRSDVIDEGPSMSISAAVPIRTKAENFVQGFKTDSGEELIGTAATPEQITQFRNRISGQTQVPQADPNTTFESRGAQIASTREPTQPRVEVRQQPSSGVQVTDLSNVAATEGGMPAKETNPELSEIRQQVEMYEGSPYQSPFQAGGAMEELRRQSMDVKALKQRVTDLGVPKSIRDDVAVFLTGATGGQAKPQPFTQKQANTRIVDLMKEGIEHLEGGKPSIQFPEGEGSKYESMTLDPSGDINVKFRKGDKTYSYPQTPEASEGFAQLAGMYNNPGPATASPFVTKKGREIGALLSQAKEKKAAAPTLKEIAGDALNLLNPFKGKKVDPREQQIRSDVNRSLGALSPEQKEAEVRRRLGQ